MDQVEVRERVPMMDHLENGGIEVELTVDEGPLELYVVYG